MEPTPDDFLGFIRQIPQGNRARISTFLILVMLAGFGLAQAENSGMALIRLDKTPPYGSYTPASGSWYGNCARTLGATEARQILSNYYRTKGLRVGSLQDKPDYFEADVFRDDDRVDRVIIHKTSGRIRSVY